MTVHIAKELAPHFEKHGMRKDGQGTSTVEDVALVAGSGLKGNENSLLIAVETFIFMQLLIFFTGE